MPSLKGLQRLGMEAVNYSNVTHICDVGEGPGHLLAIMPRARTPPLRPLVECNTSETGGI